MQKRVTLDAGERLAVDRLRQGDIVLDLRSVVHIDVTAAEVRLLTTAKAASDLYKSLV